MAKNYIVRKKSSTIFFKAGITKAEREAVEKEYAGWAFRACQPKKAPAEKHIVDAKFDISYDSVQKDDMVEYIEKFVNDKNALKDFAVASHKSKKGEVKRNSKGKLMYFHISAKDYFFEKYFPEKWADIQQLKESRKFKGGSKTPNTEDKLLALLEGKK